MQWQQAAPTAWKDPVLPGFPSQGAGPDADVGKRETIGPGSTMGMKGGKWGEKERGEQVPSPPLFIAAIDRGMCALIQVDHLLELDKHVRVWALYCHSEREREREKVRDGGKRDRDGERLSGEIGRRCERMLETEE